MTANDDAAKVPVEVELVPDSVDPALRIPGAIAAAAIAPTAALAFMTSDDGASPYSGPGVLAGGRFWCALRKRRGAFTRNELRRAGRRFRR